MRRERELRGRVKALLTRFERLRKMMRMVVELLLSFLSEQSTMRARLLRRVPQIAMRLEMRPPDDKDDILKVNQATTHNN